MYAPAPPRIASGIAASVLVAGGIVGLLLGLARPAQETPAPPADPLVVTMPAPPRADPPPPSPPPSRPRPEPGAERAGGAGAAARDRAGPRAQPAPIVVPLPRLAPLVEPPPVPVSPVAGAGRDARQGASDRDGAGPGGGGTGGSGSGGGGGGNGPGGLNPDAARYPRQVGGKLHYWEIPKALRESRDGVIRLRYRIGTDGRASQCRIIESSGMPEFDRDTCARIVERFRFRPALDRAGRAIPFWMTETHGWDR